MNLRQLPFAMVMVVAWPAVVRAQAVPATVADSSFRSFLTEFEVATRQMLSGDPTRWRAIESQRADVSLYNPFGLIVTGPEAVSTTYDKAATRFTAGSDGRLVLEYVAAGASGDLGYAVVLQHNTVQYAGQDSITTSLTRATNIFRREEGSWKLVHRHMDHLSPERCKALGPPGC